MSELINKQATSNQGRCQLLTTVSALALAGQVCMGQDAKADSDEDRPVLWIELGGQLEQQTGQGDVYSPSFIVNNSNSPAFQPVPPLHLEKPPLFSNGADARLTFQPSGTDWVFSAAVRYGRSNGKRNFDQNHVATREVTPTHLTVIGHTPTRSGYYSRNLYGPHKTKIRQTVPEFAGAQITQNQSHAVVDFMAGRDVGLGMFGKGGTSTISAGLRFAQFVSKVSGAINALPDASFLKWDSIFGYGPHHFPSYPWRGYGTAHHSYHATFQSQRSFHGIGPTLSWNASLPILGEPQAGTLNLDWGANAALLFGRQRANGSHHTSAKFYVGYTALRYFDLQPTHRTNAGNFNRSRTVTVPNVGGFAGLSFNFTNAKISAGYRGDFFFGAMDTGNDTRKTKTVGFYGPFATISIGIGG
jgi:iron complex outermembrane receptor protein